VEGGLLLITGTVVCFSVVLLVDERHVDRRGSCASQNKLW
jgi:hypothetical protein